MQTALMCGLFGVLGAATTYRWLGHTGRLANHSRQWVCFVTLFAAVAAAAFWLLLQVGLEHLPQAWARLVPYIGLIVLALFALWKPAHFSGAERESTRRIQVGILIGWIILIAICLIVFWLR